MVEFAVTLDVKYARPLGLIKHAYDLQTAPSIGHTPSKHVANALPQDRRSNGSQYRKLVIGNVGFVREYKRISLKLVGIEITELHRRVHRYDVFRDPLWIHDLREFELDFK